MNFFSMTYDQKPFSRSSNNIQASIVSLNASKEKIYVRYERVPPAFVLRATHPQAYEKKLLHFENEYGKILNWGAQSSAERVLSSKIQEELLRKHTTILCTPFEAIIRSLIYQFIWMAE